MTTKIYSSHGELTVNETGEVTDCQCCNTYEPNSCDNCIDNISKVDLKEWKTYHNTNDLPEDGIDILDVGCWTKDGRYEEPTHEWRDDVKSIQSEEN